MSWWKMHINGTGTRQLKVPSFSASVIILTLLTQISSFYLLFFRFCISGWTIPLGWRLRWPPWVTTRRYGLMTCMSIRCSWSPMITVLQRRAVPSSSSPPWPEPSPGPTLARATRASSVAQGSRVERKCNYWVWGRNSSLQEHVKKFIKDTWLQ